MFIEEKEKAPINLEDFLISGIFYPDRMVVIFYPRHSKESGRVVVTFYVEKENSANYEKSQQFYIFLLGKGYYILFKDQLYFFKPSFSLENFLNKLLQVQDKKGMLLLVLENLHMIKKRLEKTFGQSSEGIEILATYMKDYPFLFRISKEECEDIRKGSSYIIKRFEEKWNIERTYLKKLKEEYNKRVKKNKIKTL